jgi:hypothetical protein
MDFESAKLAISVVAVLVSLTALAISFFASRRTAIAGSRPVLVFEYDASSGWHVRNIGNGAALDVVVAQKIIEGDWIAPVRIPPLRKYGEFILSWCLHVNDKGLGARYLDVEQRQYWSHCADDLTRTGRGNIFPRWPRETIKRHWNVRS